MGLEAAAAALVGLAILWFLLQPIVSGQPPEAPIYEPPEPGETRRGVALAALKEIEFDKETGKLSDTDYEMLRTRYTGEALAALRADEGVPGAAGDDVEAMIAARTRALQAGAGASAISCPSCGLRPEPDAVFCSTCGGRLGTVSCGGCGAALPPDSRFCEQCGAKVATAAA